MTKRRDNYLRVASGGAAPLLEICEANGLAPELVDHRISLQALWECDSVGEEDHKSEQSPLGQLDSLLRTVAGVVGADPPAGVAADLSETDREAIERCLRLVGAPGLDHP